MVQEISAEIGDCLWYISVLADDIGVKLSDIANSNLEKLENRKKKAQSMPEMTDAASGVYNSSTTAETLTTTKKKIKKSLRFFTLDF